MTPAPYRLRASLLTRLLEWDALNGHDTLVTDGVRCYSVRRVLPCLTKGSLSMKKPSTQILEIIQAATQIDGSVTLSAEDVAKITQLTKALDRRDQQYRVGKKPAKKAAKKKRAGR